MIPFDPTTMSTTKDEKMEAFHFAQVKYELNAKQRTALGDHENYEEAMFRAYIGSLGAYENWRRFEELVADVLEMGR
jgi:hypothetical protein